MTPDKLAEIKARDEAPRQCVAMRNFISTQACDDRTDLLAYVETLTKERNEARHYAETYRDESDQHICSLANNDGRNRRTKLPWEVKP